MRVSEQSLLSPTGADLVFALFGLVAIVSAVMVVSTKQIVHAGLWLAVSLGSLAGCYLVMSADFVAWMQLLIYVGAVVVLLLFGMMLTRAPIGPSEDLTGKNRAAALFGSVGITGVLAVLVVDAYGSTMMNVDEPVGTGSVIGEAMFRYWVLPFEALSVLLLAALIGAIAISKPRQGTK
ncbi:MAG TPA: NADH-quinone oxidoreductase subunit J [Actinomycetes bacterium]|nr:NADH-quinone oxidoreductase subunit J [Actinomycetes bacterium]